MQLFKTLAIALALLAPAALAAQTPSPAAPAPATIVSPAAETPGAPQAAGDPGTNVPIAQPNAAAAAAASAPVDAGPLPGLLKPTPGVGQPVPAGWRLQEQFSPIGHEARWMSDYILDPMMVGVSVFVFMLMLYVIFRFIASRNPVASRTSHNTLIEVIWTIVPVLILVVIAVPSFRLLANQYDPPKPDVTVKAIGHQWYWEYEYPDAGGFSFDSVMLDDKAADAAGVPRKLDVDNRLVVPAGATVKVLTTGADVIHAFSVPSFWVQMDAVPGRINETWFKVDKPGVYYGQCFQLCGTRHAFMPIAIEVLPRAQYDAWIAAKQKENGIAPPTPAAAGAAEAAAAADATATGGPAMNEPQAAPAPAATN